MERAQNYWQQSLRRRRFLQLSGTAGLLAAACASPTPTGNSSGAASNKSAAAGQPTQGGRVRWASAGDPVAFDPHATISYLTVGFLDLFHARLVRYDYRSTPPYRNGGEQVIGELAQSWEAAPDNLSWTFHLKPGMKFQDKPPVSGRELTAADVKWTWERALSPGHQVEDWAWTNVYDKIEAVDPHTVKFTLKAPNGRLHLDLENYQSWVLPREADEKIGFAKLEGATIGAGPWILDTYQPGSKVLSKKNPSYGPFPGKPTLDQLEVSIIKAGEPTVAAFRAKQIDAYQAQPQFVASLKASNPDAKWKEDTLLATDTWMLSMNTQEKPFNDVRVRRAVSLAIDRDAWLKTPSIARGRIESGPVTWGEGDWKLAPDQLGDGAQWLKYDPAKAKQLLAAAGYADGFETTLSQTPQYGTSYQTEAELLQQFLAKVGIKVNIANIEYSQWIATTYNGQYHGMAWQPDNLDRLAQQLLSRYASWSSRNHSNVKDPQVDKQLADWRAIGDPQKSKQAAQDLQKLFADQVYAVYRPQPYDATTWQPYLQNYNGEREFLYEYGFRASFLWTDPVQKA